MFQHLLGSVDPQLGQLCNDHSMQDNYWAEVLCNYHTSEV